MYLTSNSNLSNRIELTPKELQKSVGVISLLSAYQIFALTDSRGRLSLQNRCKLPYEKEPFRRAFLLYLLSQRSAIIQHERAVKKQNVIRIFEIDQRRTRPLIAEHLQIGTLNISDIHHGDLPISLREQRNQA